MNRLSLLVLIFCGLNFHSLGQGLGLKFTPNEQLQGIPLASTPYSGNDLPNSKDLSNRLPPAGDQGKQNSCVAWAVAYAYKSFQEQEEEHSSYYHNGQINLSAVFSPAFIYNQINGGTDGGSFFSEALNVISQQGALKWIDMPYNETDYLTKPNNFQKEKAKNYKIDFWRRVNIQDLKEVKAQLNMNYPVCIGAMIDQGFSNDGRNARGQDYIWSREIGEKTGGHAMLVVGYDDAKGAFKVLNSWGRNWGNDGYCWISYNLFSRVVREGYVMKDAINTTEPQPNPIINPTNELPANLQVTDVQHNLTDIQFGQIMRFTGSVNLPRNIGRSAQVVIKFYYNNGYGGKGLPVGSLSAFFMMPDGTAACGTPKSTVIPGINQWFASIPYQSLNVPRGALVWGVYQPRTTMIVAEPILYIDDFAVSIGQLIPIGVNL